VERELEWSLGLSADFWAANLFSFVNVNNI
jgi:hypothetical protein